MQGDLDAHTEGYPAMLTELLARENIADRFDFLIIDSPNQISPIMENAIFPADAFIIPFESTKAVKSYASIYQLLLNLRPGADFRLIHVLINQSNPPPRTPPPRPGPHAGGQHRPCQSARSFVRV